MVKTSHISDMDAAETFTKTAHGDDIDTNTETQHNDKIIVNELLCYVWHYMKSSTPDNIKRIVLDHFSGDCISEAKKLLWKECCSVKEIEYHARRNTSLRTQAEANISDICDAFGQLDRLFEGALPFVFVACDLSKLPRNSPEELNEVALMHRVDALEKKFQLMENSVSSNHIELCDAKDKLLTQSQTIATHEQLITSVADMKAQVSTAPASSSIRNFNHRLRSDSSSSDYSDESDNEASDDMILDDALRLRRHSLPGHLGPYKPNFKSSATFIKRIQQKKPSNDRFKANPVILHKGTFSHVLKAGTRKQMAEQTPNRDRATKKKIQPSAARADGDGFITQRRRQRKRSQSDSSSQKLFLYNIKKHDSEEDVRAYMTKRKISFIDVWQSSHPDAQSKSFVLVVAKSEVNNTLNRMIWPHEVKIREFKDRRSY